MKNGASRVRRLLAAGGISLTSHLRWKIIAPYLVLTIAVAMAGTFIATRLVTATLEDRFDNQLGEAARVASDAVVRRERQHLALVRSIAFTVGVPDRAGSGDEAGLRPLVEPLAANARAEYVEVLSADGSRILGLHLGDPDRLVYATLGRSEDRSVLGLAASVVERRQDQLGDKFSAIVQVEGGAALYTAGPILDEEGRLAGVVLVGTLLESLLPTIKHEALADVTIYSFEGRVLASTLQRSDEDIGELEPRLPASGSADYAGYREIKSLFGRDFDFLYGELRVRGEPVGVFSIALPSSFISSAGSATRLEMAAVFGAATMLVLVVGLVVARSVTAPLIRLVRTARAVTEGDLAARSEIRSHDEVGTLAASFDAMTERLAQQHLRTIHALTSAIDARDPYTAGHSARVGQLSVEIGRALELPNRDLQFLEIGGYLHDIGKIGIRDSILLKAGTLTAAERALIEDHPRIGLRIIEHVELAKEVLEVVGGHHEKLNGSGYPQGLGAENLTIFARVAAVSDIYDALTTERPYRPALTVERAVAQLKAEARAGQLDEAVVLALVQVLPVWGRRLRAESSLRQGMSFGLEFDTDRVAV